MGKNNVSAWMSTTKHTGTHPRHSMHSWSAHCEFWYCCCMTKGSRQFLLQISYPSEMNKTSDLRGKIPWLTCIFLSFSSPFQAIIPVTTHHNNELLKIKMIQIKQNFSVPSHLHSSSIVYTNYPTTAYPSRIFLTIYIHIHIQT